MAVNGKYGGGLPPNRELRLKAMRNELLNNPSQRKFEIARPTLEAFVYWTGQNVELLQEIEILRAELKKYKGLQYDQDNL